MSDATIKLLNGSILHLLHRAGQIADDLFAKEITDASLTPRQYAVLLVLSQNENASQTDIVNQTGIDRSTLADIVKRLVDRGLLIRKRSKLDARAYSVRLSASGTALLRDTAPAVAKVEDRILHHLQPNRRPEMIDGLATIVHKTAPISAVAARARRP